MFASHSVLDDGTLGGWFESEDNLSQEGSAKVFGNAWISGNAVVSGNSKVFSDYWDITPLHIQGSVYSFSVSSKNSISIGCLTKIITNWQETYETEFQKYGFTAGQQTEYKLYFNLASQLYGWNIQLPINET